MLKLQIIYKHKVITDYKFRLVLYFGRPLEFINPLAQWLVAFQQFVLLKYYLNVMLMFKHLYNNVTCASDQYGVPSRLYENYFGASTSPEQVSEGRLGMYHTTRHLSPI